MVYFLLTYDRRAEQSEVVTYADPQEAQRAYAEQELKHYDDRAVYEIVLLSAPDETHIRKTHSRYFTPAAAL